MGETEDRRADSERGERHTASSRLAGSARGAGPDRTCRQGPRRPARARRRHAPDGRRVLERGLGGAARRASRRRPESPAQHLDPPVGLVPRWRGRRIPTLSRLPRLRLGGAARTCLGGGALRRGSDRGAAWSSAVIGTSRVARRRTRPQIMARSPAPTGGAPWHRGPQRRRAARVELEGRLCCRCGGGPGRKARDQEAAHAAGSRSRAHAREEHAAHHVRTSRRCASLHRIAGTDRHRGGGVTLTPTRVHLLTTPSSQPTQPHRRASAGGATGSKPATGPAGPTRIGSVTGGCSPKCS